jgi:hypothetical protein
MTSSDWLTTREIGEVFAEEISTAGGKVIDRFDDGFRIYLRAVLRREREVRRRDRIQGGVALRATPEEISVHPYVFRQVCSNGAIRAHALETRQISRDDFQGADAPRQSYALVEAIRVCCSEAAFAESAREMRSARSSKLDAALEMMSFLARMGHDPQMQAAGAAILDQYFDRTRAKDRSRFGFMNIVTSVARDQRDPEVRWRLEELGGGIPVAPSEPDFEPSPVEEKVLVEA